MCCSLGLLWDEVDLGIMTRVQVGRRGKAGTKKCVFKTQVEDLFQPMLSFTPSLAGKGGEIAWTKCTSKNGRVFLG